MPSSKSLQSLRLIFQNVKQSQRKFTTLSLHLLISCCIFCQLCYNNKFSLRAYQLLLLRHLSLGVQNNFNNEKLLSSINIHPYKQVIAYFPNATKYNKCNIYNSLATIFLHHVQFIFKITKKYQIYYILMLLVLYNLMSTLLCQRSFNGVQIIQQNKSKILSLIWSQTLQIYVPTQIQLSSRKKPSPLPKLSSNTQQNYSTDLELQIVKYILICQIRYFVFSFLLTFPIYTQLQIKTNRKPFQKFQQLAFQNLKINASFKKQYYAGIMTITLQPKIKIVMCVSMPFSTQQQQTYEQIYKIYYNSKIKIQTIITMMINIVKKIPTPVPNQICIQYTYYNNTTTYTNNQVLQTDKQLDFPAANVQFSVRIFPKRPSKQLTAISEYSNNSQTNIQKCTIINKIQEILKQIQLFMFSKTYFKDQI
eukprot:TRINITY_DN7412_c0_g2_i1.p1 TRINITY_DN7412_c0_g2~~TRINITY_DN7412_c0_g2_i1.p1  ORF type:complete len:421 (+),score=-24.25 TRINITY_DN7412_c0_g2_i1:75-1337(+)